MQFYCYWRKIKLTSFEYVKLCYLCKHYCRRVIWVLVVLDGLPQAFWRKPKECIPIHTQEVSRFCNRCLYGWMPNHTPHPLIACCMRRCVLHGQICNGSHVSCCCGVFADFRRTATIDWYRNLFLTQSETYVMSYLSLSCLHLLIWLNLTYLTFL